MSGAGKPSESSEIFLCYSHKDEKLLKKLETHLSLLRRDKIISIWHDRRIGAGTEWAGAIDKHLNSARIILLLVSADFLASDYCHDVEMERARASRGRGGPCHPDHPPPGRLDGGEIWQAPGFPQGCQTGDDMEAHG